MEITVDCLLAEREDLVSGYVAGTLSETELEEFEQHLLECSICQEEVREAAVIKSALRVDAIPRVRRRRFLYLLPIAAAAVLVGIMMTRGDELRKLGDVAHPPVFEGTPIRASADNSADLGMAAYSRGDYAEAAELLQQAPMEDHTPGLFFFLGVSQLLSDNADGAVVSLQRTANPPGNPYVDEARFYSAKAWLQMRRPDSALIRLRSIPEDAGLVHRHAVALIDSIITVVGR